VFFNQGVDESPEQATNLGLDKGARIRLKSQLNDYSAAGNQARLGRVKDRLARLRRIDRSELSPKSQLDYDLARTVASETRFTLGSARGNFQPYVIAQRNGPYQSIPDFLDSQHKIATADDADAYLSRLSGFPKALDDSLARQQADAARGIFAPDFALDTTLQQLNALRGQPAAATVLVESVVRRSKAAGLTADYAGRATQIVEAQVFPALDRHIAAITALRAKATHDAGVWRLPDGDAYYAAAVKASTTTEFSPADVHRLGLEQVADELGVYEGDPLGRIGCLQSFLFRAGRLVTDTGIHYKRWSREKATDYLIGVTGSARPRIQREIDRYAVGPAQALSYKVGHTKWVELRGRVRTKQGAAWDPKAFHDVLRQGSMPLVILERVVMARA